MKKLMLCLLAVTFAMSLSVFAEQDNNMAQTQADQCRSPGSAHDAEGYGQGRRRQVHVRQR